MLMKPLDVTTKFQEIQRMKRDEMVGDDQQSLGHRKLTMELVSLANFKEEKKNSGRGTPINLKIPNILYGTPLHLI